MIQLSLQGTILKQNLIDLIALDRPFIANPNYPKRLLSHQALSEFDDNTLFGGDAEGYTTYS